MPLTNGLAHVWRPSAARRVALDGFGIVPRGPSQTNLGTPSWPAKDPFDVLDYEFDIASALMGNEGDGISAVDVTVTPSGSGDLLANSVAADGSLVVIWFAGGNLNTVYTVQIAVITSSGRSINRAVLLPCLALASSAQTSSALTSNQGGVVTDQFGNPILLGS